MHGIGWAVKQLQDGFAVRRAGWNGKNMFLVFVRGGEVVIKPGTPYANAVGEGSVVTIDSHIDMYTAKRSMQPGWLASQADLLANDWELA